MFGLHRFGRCFSQVRKGQPTATVHLLKYFPDLLPDLTPFGPFSMDIKLMGVDTLRHRPFLYRAVWTLLLRPGEHDIHVRLICRVPIGSSGNFGGYRIVRSMVKKVQGVLHCELQEGKRYLLNARFDCLHNVRDRLHNVRGGYLKPVDAYQSKGVALDMSPEFFVEPIERAERAYKIDLSMVK